MTTPNRSVSEPIRPGRENAGREKAPETEDERLNRDPISGAPGSHAVGTGAGAAAGGIAGAGVGAVAGGPIGAGVGGVVGAIAGGLAGKGIAEQFDPTEEEKYWRGNYQSRPYVDRTLDFEEYAPAYRYGSQSWIDRSESGRSFDEVENDLRSGWERAKSKSKLSWEKAKDAARDGWQRVSERFGRDDLRADDDGMRPDRERAAKRGPDAGDSCCR